MNGESIVVQKGTSGNFSLALGLISSSIKSVVWNKNPLETQHYSSIQHGVRRLQDRISSLSFISCVVLDTSSIYNSKAQFPYMKKMEVPVIILLYLTGSGGGGLEGRGWGGKSRTWFKWKYFHSARYTASIQEMLVGIHTEHTFYCNGNHRHSILSRI